MTISRWPPWGLALIVAAAVFLALLPLRPERPARPPPFPAAATSVAPAARVCVTRHGLCPVGMARAGDPCACPHSLRGSVPGHVEQVGGKPVHTDPSDWPEDEEDPFTLLGPLVGP